MTSATAQERRIDAHNADSATAAARDMRFKGVKAVAIVMDCISQIPRKELHDLDKAIDTEISDRNCYDREFKMVIY